MGYSNTTELALRKDDGNETIVNWRVHNNDNLDLIDSTVGNLVDAIANAKALLGQLGLDQNGNPIVDAATARSTLDAAQSEDAAGSLYDAEQAIGVNAGNIASNASAISSLQDSVDPLTITPRSGYTVTVEKRTRVGALMFVRATISRNVASEALSNLYPFDVTGAREGIVNGDYFNGGIVWNGKNAYLRSSLALEANRAYSITCVFII